MQIALCNSHSRPAPWVAACLACLEVQLGTAGQDVVADTQICLWLFLCMQMTHPCFMHIRLSWPVLDVEMSAYFYSQYNGTNSVHTYSNESL